MSQIFQQSLSPDELVKAALAIEIRNMIQFQIIDFLKNTCPNIWSIFNQKAKLSPSKGFEEFVSGDGGEVGKEWLKLADQRISHLILTTSDKQVGDAYRRDISAAKTANIIAEIFCELTLADSLGSISSNTPELRPKSGTGTECDVKVVINGFDLFGDSKRLEDTWQGGKRSFSKSPPGSKPSDSDRPRSMDLHSKLKDTPRQFPENTLNVIFLFHPSTWNSEIYIKRALFGDKSSFNQDPIKPHEDGLFTLQDWKNISALALSVIRNDGSFSVSKVWRNPNCNVDLPVDVENKLLKIG